MTKRQADAVYASPKWQRDVFIVHCPKCEAKHLASSSSIESTHRTADGLVGYIRCVAGHLVIHQLTEAYPKPKPPPSVIALRARLAAEEAGLAQATGT